VKCDLPLIEYLSAQIASPDYSHLQLLILFLPDRSII
jgi:hypothetical protein